MKVWGKNSQVQNFTKQISISVVHFYQAFTIVIQSLSSEQYWRDIPVVNVFAAMCFSFLKCSFNVGGIGGKYQNKFYGEKHGKKAFSWIFT